MPIRPENRARYPKTWKQMVAQARERSCNQCECDGKCGQDHEGGRCAARNGQPHPDTGSTVVLTLAHEHGVPLEETSIERMFHACRAATTATMRLCAAPASPLAPEKRSASRICSPNPTLHPAGRERSLGGEGVGWPARQDSNLQPQE